MDLDWIESIDILASEYCWSIEYIQSLSLEEVNSLIKKINERKIVEWNVECYIMNCAFVGKKPQFKSNENQETKEVDAETLKKIMKTIGGKVEKI